MSIASPVVSLPEQLRSEPGGFEKTSDQIPVPICFATLFRMASDGGDLISLRERVIAEPRSNSVAAAAALMSLCTIEQLLGDQASGLAYQAGACGLHRLYRSSWPASPDALRVLAFKAAGDFSTNTPIEFLLEGSDVVLYSLYVVPGQSLPPLPDHDIAIFTAGESDRERPVMQMIGQLIRTWPCPVLNRPDRVIHLSRENLPRLMRDVPGVVVPVAVRMSRVELKKNKRFPIIARPVGSHAGRGLAKLDTAGDVDAWLDLQHDSEFFVSPYVDYRSADGKFRKYRIVWIDDRPYPCHMAIADRWDVWYYNAGMEASTGKRMDEEHFISTFDVGFALRHAAALAAIATCLGLEYVGIDCAELPDGRLIVFEADISLVVHDLDPPEIYPYKSRPMQTIFVAFYEMLKRRSK